MLELSTANPALTSPADKQRAAEWEKILLEGLSGSDSNEPGASSVTSPTGPSPPPNTAAPLEEGTFQKSIRQAMERLKSSDSTLQVSSAEPSNDFVIHFGRCI